MVFAFYQFPPVETTSDDFPSVFSVVDDFSYLIRGDFPTRGYSIAEQGFIAFFDDPDKCPLEFLNEDKPFKIIHENQILHIRSNYFNNINRQQPCQWKFAAPVGYGFKMVVQKLNISATTSFSIQNSTDIITK
uniref:Uncharacterized protein n=1 Tax=Panagrolaimus davidi TaxID=227884 RepID=A0A914QIG0_9BILA